MKRYILTICMVAIAVLSVMAQGSILSGKCGDNARWTFDGKTLVINNIDKHGKMQDIEDYDLEKRVAPWIKQKFNIKTVVFGNGIQRIGSCAFANCTSITDVIFQGSDLVEIGWGAFLNCSHLRSIALPVNLKSIGTLAFAKCTSLSAIKIPDQCRVEDQAFVSCTKLKSVELSPTAILGHHVFASEALFSGKVRHKLYDGEIRRLPPYINLENCNEYGFARSAVEKCVSTHVLSEDFDYATSEVDTIIPNSYFTRNSTYALIIGNQNYRFVTNVPYAIHDARVFGEYCKKTLGLPVNNIHVTEDATKQMILEEEIEDWLAKIPNREFKKLIVYYAGHGVPDTKNRNKAYLLPTDVRGTSPHRGIALDDFYARLGKLNFAQTSVFLDACFSGVNRNSEGVADGLRGVEIEAENATLDDGALVVFSAAQGNETAQGYPEQGHGLFTYCLLRELQESQGQIDFGTLSDKLYENVRDRAPLLKMRKSQTPSISTTQQVADLWRSFSF